MPGDTLTVPAWDKHRYVVRNVTRDAVLAHRSGRASNIVSRGLGLMMHRELPVGSGLIIEPCNSVVCFFMRFPIDVLFVGKDGLVLRAVSSLAPWRTSAIVRGSAYVVELPAGTLNRTETQAGDRISYSLAGE